MIPVDDRGFALGDGLFETVLVRGRELVAWEAHLARLVRGCGVLGLPPPDPRRCLAAVADALGQAEVAGERRAVRLSWSAGSGGRGLDRPAAPAPRLVVQVSPAPASAVPATLATVEVRRNEGSPASRLKTLAYVDNVLARAAARASGADEALMLNNRGELCCAGAANLFWVEAEGALVTPGLDCGVLDGTIRAMLMARAREAGWTVRETRAPRPALEGAAGLFLTNSLVGVRPVSGLDGRALAPDPRVEALAALVRDLS